MEVSYRICRYTVWTRVGDGSLAYTIGSRVRIRGEEWLVRNEQPLPDGSSSVRVMGISETVRDYEATFLTSLDPVQSIKPETTIFVRDDSESYRRTRLFLHALMMRTPILSSVITTRGQVAMEDSAYQFAPAQKALAQVRPRILIADGVGLGKTIEAGILLAELIRRGRGRRVLVVSMRSMLQQIQKEMWTRFSIPLMRLDSVGIAWIRREIPQNKNPFHYYEKVIVSIDTLKNDEQYRRYLENCHWDAVWIDECHNVANANTDRNQLATLLADHCHSLILTSATPHNGKAESFAALLHMLDPTSVIEAESVSPEQIEHLVIRRFKADVVRDTTGFHPVHDAAIDCEMTAQEDRVLQAIFSVDIHELTNPSQSDALFQVTLLKSFLSSPEALAETVSERVRKLIHRLEAGTAPSIPTWEQDVHSLTDLTDVLQGVTIRKTAKYQELQQLLRTWNWNGKASSPRVILFSERIGTLRALQDALVEDFRLQENTVRMFTASLSDVEQQDLVSEFNEEDSPIRLMLASDVASEGVNLHHRCHHMIHFDIPWSFIRLQQRNGRIDRFGQQQDPEIRYLVSRSSTRDGDTRIVQKLVEKARLIEHTLGDPSSILRLFAAEDEEQFIEEQLASHVDVDRIVPDSPDGFSFDFFDPIPQTKNVEAIQLAETLTLYDSWQRAAQDLRSELSAERQRYKQRTGFEDVLRQDERIELDSGTGTVAISGVRDLDVRMRALPPDARQTDEWRLAVDVKRIMRSIQVATADGSWPREHLLWDIHPVAEWMLDRASGLYEAQEAPHLILPHLPQGETWYILQAILPTKSGHPAWSGWLVACDDGTTIDVRPWHAKQELLLSSPWINDGKTAKVGSDPRLPDVVQQVKATVQVFAQGAISALETRVAAERDRVEAWYQRSEQALDRGLSNPIKIEALQVRRREKKRAQLERTYQATVQSLQALLDVEQQPVLRVACRVTRG